MEGLGLSTQGAADGGSGAAPGVGGSGLDTGGSPSGSGGHLIVGGSSSGGFGGFSTGGSSTGGSFDGSGGAMEGPSIEPAELDAVPLEMELEIEFSVPEVGGELEYAFVSGTLPVGVVLSPAGVLSGVPHEPGTFAFEVSARTAGGEEPIVGSFQLVVEKQRFLAARNFVSSSSTTTELTVYDLELGGKATPPQADEGSISMTRMSPDGKWLLFTTRDPETDLQSAYTVYLGDGLGAMTSNLFMEGWNPDCSFHPRGWGLACTLELQEPVLTLYSLEGDLMMIERQVEGGKFFGFRENHSVFFEQGDQLAAIEWVGREPGELTNFRIIGTKYIAPTGDRVITDWKDEGEVLGITVFDLEGWYSANLISAWFAADEGYRFVETWDCPEGESCDRRIHYISPDGELSRLFSESIEGWDLPPAVSYHEFFGGVRVFSRSDGILVDFVTETGGEREVILPRDGGLLGAVSLSADGTALCWQETGGTQGASTFVSWIEDGRVSDPIDLDGALFEFSPSGRRLLLKKPVGDESYQLIVHDVTRGELKEIANVPLPIDWVNAEWSRDESHLAIIGGNPAAGRRELYVIDLWDDEPVPELLEFCPPSTEAEPRCPGTVVF